MSDNDIVSQITDIICDQLDVEPDQVAAEKEAEILKGP